jgi:hypothetical protein
MQVTRSVGQGEIQPREIPEDDGKEGDRGEPGQVSVGKRHALQLSRADLRKS